jgi:hypothetical protein
MVADAKLRHRLTASLDIVHVGRPRILAALGMTLGTVRHAVVAGAFRAGSIVARGPRIFCVRRKKSRIEQSHLMPYHVSDPQQPLQAAPYLTRISHK